MGLFYEDLQLSPDEARSLVTRFSKEVEGVTLAEFIGAESLMPMGLPLTGVLADAAQILQTALYAMECETKDLPMLELINLYYTYAVVSYVERCGDDLDIQLAEQDFPTTDMDHAWWRAKMVKEFTGVRKVVKEIRHTLTG